MRTMAAQHKKSSPGKASTGKLRIIGGRWRGRRFVCPPGMTTRPTGDRVRETLFNWLAPYIAGTRCLDLFAGTGALGLEALSRGAQSACFVDRDAAAIRQLDTTLHELDCDDGTVIKGDARRFLSGVPERFDLVFIDPPFGDLDLANLCTLLEANWLAPSAHIYIEMSRQAELPVLPDAWEIWRDKSAGQVRFMLARRCESQEASKLRS